MAESGLARAPNPDTRPRKSIQEAGRRKNANEGEIGASETATMSCWRQRAHVSLAAALLCISVSPTAEAQARIFPQRDYVEGSEYRYRLAQSETRNGEVSTLEGVVSLKVERRGKAFVERVRWLSLGKAASPDDEAARSLPAYILSLSPGESLESPRPRGSVALLGMVTDFQTFYAAISPGLGVDELSAVGKTVRRPQPVLGEFADGEIILSGRDCTIASLTVRSLTPDAVTLETSFDPPSQSCLAGGADPNVTVQPNFTMVRKVGTFFLTLVGTEQFTIVSQVSRRDGQLIEAEMVNRLELEGRRCTDETLRQCTSIPPISRIRTVRLVLEAGTPAVALDVKQ